MLVEVALDNAEWDALLATDKSQALLAQLADEAIAEHKAGTTRQIVFNEGG